MYKTHMAYAVIEPRVPWVNGPPRTKKQIAKAFRVVSIEAMSTDLVLARNPEMRDGFRSDVDNWQELKTSGIICPSIAIWSLISSAGTVLNIPFEAKVIRSRNPVPANWREMVASLTERGSR